MVQFAPDEPAQSAYLGRFDCIFCMNADLFSESRRPPSSSASMTT
jgi:hypothetical protein